MLKKYMDAEDDTLVERTLLGDGDAYEALVLRHEKAVKGTAFRVTGNQFSAEDAAQDAFVTAWMKLDSLRERDRFGAWVCSIAKNCARNLVAHYHAAVPDISLDLLENTAATGSDESGLAKLYDLAQLGEQERDGKLHEAVEALSEKIRETVRLHYFDGLSVAEIARTLSLPEGTVKWRLSEGRKQLRKEYGVMEEQYDEKEALVKRVMRQVEELKLWRLKRDKTGFEADYRAVLAQVEALDESQDKQHALADVLLHGYWWLPGEKNQNMLARIKAAAEASHNEEAMQMVMAEEHDQKNGQEKLDFMRTVQMPYLEEHRLVKTLGYVWFWYAVACLDERKTEEGFAALRRVTDLLTPSDVYYATALAALDVEERRKALEASCDENPFLADKRSNRCVEGEVYCQLGQGLYFWEQPGYGRGGLACRFNHSLVWSASRCDGLILDATLRPGQSRVSTDGCVTLTCLEDSVSVSTPTGMFGNCTVYRVEERGTADGEVKHFTETAFCPGVGIVRQIVNHYGTQCEWQLTDYTVRGGEGLFPLATGNEWAYTCVTEMPGQVLGYENRYTVTASEGGRSVVSHPAFTHLKGYDPHSWEGQMLKARREYCYHVSDEEERLADVSDALSRAAVLAVTQRQKRHTAIATQVMDRILGTDPDFTPACTQVGRWNFFELCAVNRQDGRVSLAERRDYSFEWKNSGALGEEGYKVLYNFLYDILSVATGGCIWSDQWVPGYEEDRNVKYFGHRDTHLKLQVLEDQSVTVPAGHFADCRHISLELTGLTGGLAYRGGQMEYWFAPGVGIVCFSRPVSEKTGNVWQLTAFCGTGEGYFPTDDGLFRRYEPESLSDGWHGSVEYTFDVDESGTVLFRNALGTQDRENYEAAMKGR